MLLYSQQINASMEDTGSGAWGKGRVRDPQGRWGRTDDKIGADRVGYGSLYEGVMGHRSGVGRAGCG